MTDPKPPYPWRVYHILLLAVLGWVPVLIIARLIYEAV